MVKRKYKKNLNKWALTIFMIAGAIGIFGIGAWFFDGGLLNVFGLKYLPLVIHQIVGILLMLTGVGSLIGAFIRK